MNAPSTWFRVKLGEVAIERTEREDTPEASSYDRYVGSDDIGRFELRVTRWRPASEVSSTVKVFHPGDYLFVRRSLYASDFRERAARADFSGLCSGDILPLREIPGSMVDGFLGLVLNHPRIWEFVVRHATGSITRRIKWKDLKEYEFALPPLDEQRRIVWLLSSAGAVVETLADAETAGAEVRTALILHLYTRGVRKEPLCATAIGEVPASWAVQPLESRVEVQLGKMVSEGAKMHGIPTPYLRNANIQWNRLDLSDISTMAFSDEERKKFCLLVGDILACEGRHVGKSAIWKDELPGACYQKALHRLRCSESVVPEFLLHCLYFYSITGRFAGETGETTIPHLPAERLRAMPFPFPEHDEQLEIARTVGAMDNSLQTVRQRLELARMNLLERIPAQVLAGPHLDTGRL